MASSTRPQERDRITIQARTASGHRRGWLKVVSSVDTSKINGYAFVGTFLKDGENDLPHGSIIVEQFPTGPVRRGVDKGEAFRVTPEGLESFATCDDWRKHFLSFRDAVAAALLPDVCKPMAMADPQERPKNARDAFIARIAALQLDGQGPARPGTEAINILQSLIFQARALTGGLDQEERLRAQEVQG